jgi:exopolysaccharide biosynthesis polyprenyl glycosylphosphotransferase
MHLRRFPERNEGSSITKADALRSSNGATVADRRRTQRRLRALRPPRSVEVAAVVRVPTRLKIPLDLPRAPNATDAHREPAIDRAEGDPTRSDVGKPLIPSHRLRTGLVLADAGAVLIGATIAFTSWYLVIGPRIQEFQAHLLLFAASYPLWLVSIAARKLLVARAIVQPAEELRRIWTAAALGTVLTVVLSFVLGYQTLSRGWVVMLLVSVGTTLTAERVIARRIFRRLRASGRITRRVAVIGTDTNAIRIMHMLQQNRSLGYSVVGYIGDEDIGDRGECRWLGPLHRTTDLLREQGCTGAIVSLNSLDSTAVNRLARTLTDEGIHVALSTSLNDISLARLRPQSVDGRTMLYVEPTIRDGWRARAKRTFDVVVSALALVLAAPILLLAAMAIWIDSGGSVLFRQQRIGRDGVTFSMLKLRTMHHDAETRLHEVLHHNESDGPLFKSSTDPRVTRVGRFLRKWSIDEIPQFWNVLRGDMSFVGPRPALPREVEAWDTATAERLRVLPGITGLWQVEGRSTTSFDDYKRLDLYYVDNWSLAHDLVIVWKTFGAVLSGRGAF